METTEKKSLLSHNNNNNNTPIFVYIAAILCCISSLNTGYDIGIIASAIIFIQQDLNINNTQIELMVSFANLFAIIGSILGGNIAHNYGRKKVIIASAIISCFAVLIMSFTSNFIIILLSRSMNGIAIGCSLLIAPLYISEMAPSNIRGKLVSLNEIFVNIGHIIGYTMALILFYFNLNAGISWRIMIGSGSIISFGLFISMLFMPETPRWLNKNGYPLKAKKVLMKTTNSMEKIDKLLIDMDETNKILDINEIGWKQIIFPCVFKPDISLRKALAIAAPIAIAQQLCGIEIFVYYIPKIMQENGLNEEWILIGTLLVGSSKLFFLLISQSLSDKLGRRSLLIISAFLMALSVCILGIIVQFENNINLSNILIIIMLICIVSSFSIGYGPITWLLNSEIFAQNIRSKAMGYCTFLNRASATFVTLTFFSLSNIITQYGVYYLYAIVGFIFVIFVYFKVPETKSKTLEEITKMLIS